MNKFGGIYRGICSNNDDPEHLLRIKVKVAAVYGENNESEWAWPCFPPGVLVPTDGGDYAPVLHTHRISKLVPQMLDPVWVMFEAGDIHHPVWMGMWKVTGG